MNKIICNKKGFSLLEVLIGLILLAVGMLAVASLQVASVRGNFFSQNISEATYAMQDRIELLKNIPYGNLTGGDHDDGTITISGVVYIRSYSVNTSAAFKTITYTVRWNDGINHEITFSTIRCQ